MIAHSLRGETFGPARRCSGARPGIYQLDGSGPYFGAAGCQVTSGGRDSAWIVCPRRTTLVRRETRARVVRPGCRRRSGR